MITAPYEVLLRRNGETWAVMARTLTTFDDGSARENSPVQLSGLDDPAFAEIAAIVNAGNAAAVQSLTAQLEDSVSADDHDIVVADLAAANAEIERLTALVPPPVDPNAVPEFITAVQGRLILRRMGLLDQIEAMIIDMNGESQIFWEYSANWHRNNPTLQGLGTSMGLTSEQVDDMFRAAKLIGEAE